MAAWGERFGGTGAYLIAGAAVVAAAILRAGVSGDLIRVPPLSFFAAVTVAAWLGGYGPAAVAAAGSLLVMWAWGTLPLDAPHLAGAVLLAASGQGVAWVAATVRAARARADQHALAARRRQEALEQQMADRERAERALRDQYVLTQSITDNAAAALCMTDAGGRCTYMNPAAEELLGYSFVQLRGRVLHDVLHAAHAGDGERTCPLSSGAPSEALRAHLDNVRRADATSVPVLCALTPILRSGTAVGSVIELSDVSVERRAAQDREALLQVTEQARLNAEAASRSKDEFLAVLSHELRAPLQAMVGWLAALRLQPGDAAMVSRAADALDRSLRVQGDLVNDLLDVSRIVSGKLTLERTWVDLGLIVAASVDLVRPAAADKGLTLHLVPPAEPVPLLGDPGRLQQMVGNLLGNAIKFTPRGGRVEVCVARDATHAEAVVSDDGEGIAADVLPHIFERFHQADSQSTRAHGGLGLGLAIVRHLAEAHGGVAQATSAGPGRGATFRIALPLAAGEQPAAAPVDSAAPPELEGVQVLLVDDDADSTEALALALAHKGARVAMATSVAEALARLARDAFDVVVSDVGMPGESGLSLARAIRAREAGGAQHLPIIALTGFASREDHAMALAAGFDDHLAKPVDIALLMARVGLLAHRRAESPLPLGEGRG